MDLVGGPLPPRRRRLRRGEGAGHGEGVGGDRLRAALRLPPRDRRHRRRPEVRARRHRKRRLADAPRPALEDRLNGPVAATRRPGGRASRRGRGRHGRRPRAEPGRRSGVPGPARRGAGPGARRSRRRSRDPAGERRAAGAVASRARRGRHLDGPSRSRSRLAGVGPASPDGGRRATAACTWSDGLSPTEAVRSSRRGRSAAAPRSRRPPLARPSPGLEERRRRGTDPRAGSRTGWRRRRAAVSYVSRRTRAFSRVATANGLTLGSKSEVSTRSERE